MKRILAFAASLLASSMAMAASLVVDVGPAQATYTTGELLARPDASTIQVPGDITYHRTMTYRAVPLRALLGASRPAPGTELQITGTDGFVTHLPTPLVFDDKKPRAEAWLAIEPSDAPWPRAPDGGDIGPFYVVWIDPGASTIRSEQWPYKVDAIRTAQTPEARWPQLAVAANVPAGSAIRRGQSLFTTQCMACHKMNGAGDASMGPDLGTPHNPTEYFQPWALKQLIRDPRSVRAWPDMKMHGFDTSAMSDGDIDAVIAYLHYEARRRAK